MNHSDRTALDIISAVLIGTIVTIMVILAIDHIKSSEDSDSIKCSAEDMIPVEITEDSFDFKAGDKTCIHIDNL